VVAGDAALDLLGRIMPAPMLNRIDESFVQRQLNFEFAAGGTTHFINNSHDVFNDGRDRFDVARQRQVQFYQKTTAVEFAACNGFA
jgi:hypothetical protein